MLLREMIRFLKYDHRTLYRVLTQFHVTWRDDHRSLGSKNLVLIPRAFTHVTNLPSDGTLNGLLKVMLPQYGFVAFSYCQLN